MELALGALALLVAIVGLAIAWQLRERLRALEGRLEGAEQHLARMEAETREIVADVQAQLGQTTREVSERKAATEILPPNPPRPRGRSRRLDDLRERLRAAHREEGAESDADA